jgi:periplasmic protein CpxP/Spy
MSKRTRIFEWSRRAISRTGFRTGCGSGSRTALWIAGAVLLWPLGTAALAQPEGAPPGPPAGLPPPGAVQIGPMGPMQLHRPPMEQAFHMGPRGRWWDNPEFAQKIGISSDQQKKMDDIFQQSRLKLIDMHAAVEKQETILEPLISADQPNEGQILKQIDAVAQARAELEKANARMLLGLRGVLTADQWKKLQAEEQADRGSRRIIMRQERGVQEGPPPPPGE